MNAKNTNLLKAKKEANDEFYTQYEDVAKEIEHYKEHLKGKVIYCNCDIPYFSNFHKYFLDNFKDLELKKLIVTGYVKNGNGKCSIYDGETSTDYDLLGDGDFRGDECVDMLQKADVVITNPPFSLFREFIKVLVDNGKDFIVVGNMNAITYKEVFPLIKDNKMWGGIAFNKSMVFTIPNDYYSKSENRDNMGRKLGKVPAITWFTNIEHGKRHEPLKLNTMEHNLKSNTGIIKNPCSYQKYDNYDAIEVPLTAAIPSDYTGVMGVPISFLGKYNPEQFEILGVTQRGCHNEFPDIKKYDDYWEVRQSGEKTGSRGGKTNENANLEINDGKKNYFINKDGHIVQSSYQRIFIRHKTKETP